MALENRNYAFAGAFVDELARCGLRHACICPGSRSSPLAISLARHPAIRTWVHVDERSGGFFALGMALALGEPVAILCTSGTAAANFHPAVAEAHNATVPLLVLTADRPPELWDWGALQTIDQVRLYGSHAKWSVTMPLPEATTAIMAFVRSTACRAFGTALEPPAGPVHLNFPFREPLEPATVRTDFPQAREEMSGEAWQGRADGRPFIAIPSHESRSKPEEIKAMAAHLASWERGVIVCGPQPDAALAEAVTALAHKLSYPILADPLSQVRCGAHDTRRVIDSYDAFLREPGLAASLAPEVVLRFGALPVSRALVQYLERHRAARQAVINTGGWADPLHVASDMLHVDPVIFCNDVTAALEGERNATAWTNRWLKVAEAASAAMGKRLGQFQEMFEGKVFSELAPLLPNDTLLFAGNSMPVRDMEAFFPCLTKSIRFLANRGAGGIDGVVSTALGATAATGKRLVLVIGDLSFYHDMNGLLAAKAHGLNATIIVINNDGGGIFSFLPQAAYKEVFEPYFGTPHGLTFQAAAELYGLAYRKVVDWSQFRQAVAHSVAAEGTAIIEVPSARALNVTLHRQVWAEVAAAVQDGVRD